MTSHSNASGHHGTQPVVVPGPAGELQARLTQPQGAARGLCVVCHPHPLYGGTMDNKVVYTLAAAAAGQGFLALRFNFRGVGDSQGRYDKGRGEVGDVLAATTWLRDNSGKNSPLLLAGFSFGAQMALRAAQQLGPDRIVTVGTPAAGYIPGEDPQAPSCPWLAIHGRDDDVVDCEHTAEWLAAFAPHADFQRIDGTGHFFHRQLTPLRKLVEDFLGADA